MCVLLRVGIRKVPNGKDKKQASHFYFFWILIHQISNFLEERVRRNCVFEARTFSFIPVFITLGIGIPFSETAGKTKAEKTNPVAVHVKVIMIFLVCFFKYQKKYENKIVCSFWSSSISILIKRQIFSLPTGKFIQRNFIIDNNYGKCFFGVTAKQICSKKQKTVLYIKRLSFYVCCQRHESTNWFLT